MNNSILDFIQKLSQSWFNFMTDQIFISLILFAFVFGLTFILRRKVLWLQLGLWSLILLKLIIPSDLSVKVIPSTFNILNILRLDKISQYSTFNQNTNSTEQYNESSSVTTSSELLPSTNVNNTANIKYSNNSKRQTVWFPIFLFLIWICGVIIILLFILQKSWQLRKIQEKTRLNENNKVNDIILEWSIKTGITKEIKVYSGENILTPFTIGMFSPKIYLPAELISNLNMKELEAILLHELMHIKRYDGLITMIQNLISALFFFHPIVWITNSKINSLKEETCDLMVLNSSEMKAEFYGHVMIKVIKANFLTRTRKFAPALMFGNPKHKFINRIKTISSHSRIGQKYKWIQFLAIFVIWAVFLTCGIKEANNKNVENEIRNIVSEFNQSYESKNADKYVTYFSKLNLMRRKAGDNNNLENWKQILHQKYFSPWKQIKIQSDIISIDDVGNEYIVTEIRSLKGVDFSDNEHLLKDNVKRILIFRKEENQWKIDDVREVTLPPIYKNISSDYQQKGRTGLAYVCHITQNFVSVLDLQTNQLVGTIPSGYGSTFIAFSPDNQKGYITNYHSNNVTVFDKNSNKILATVPTGENPTNVIVTSNNQFALIAHQSNSPIFVMDAQTNNIINQFPEGTGQFYWLEKSQKMYQVEIFRPFVFTINLSSQRIIKKIHVGGRPLHLACTPDEKYAYVTNFDLKEVTKIDVQTDEVVHRIPNIDSPRGITLSVDGKFAYVTNVVANIVTIIDVSEDTVFKTIHVGKMPTYAAASQTNNYVYVTNQGSASISVIDPNLMEVIKTIQVADNPITITIDDGASKSL